jgi:hypothetical protein
MSDGRPRAFLVSARPGRKTFTTIASKGGDTFDDGSSNASCIP